MISATADSIGTPEGIAAAETLGSLAQADRTCSRTDTGVPSLKETRACCWPSALSNCEHPVTPSTPDRPSTTAGITTRGSTRTDVAYVVSPPSTVLGDRKTYACHAVSPYPHRQRSQGDPAGLRDRRAALRRGSRGPGAEDLHGLSRHDRAAHRAAGRLRVRPSPVAVQRPRRGRRRCDTRRLRPGLAGQLDELPGVHRSVPGCGRAAPGRGRALRGTARPGTVRRRQPGPDA